MLTLSSGILSDGCVDSIAKESRVIQDPIQVPEEDIDTFEISNGEQGNMSLRLKLIALHEALGISFSCHPVEPNVGFLTVSQGTDLFLELPSPEVALHLLQVYFEEHNPYYPCVDQISFEDRVLQWISSEGYEGNSRKIAVPPARRSLAALLCIVFAIADFIDPQKGFNVGIADTATSVPGRSWYQKGASILKHCRHHKSTSLDIISFHTLEAMYMIDVERLGMAGTAVSLAVSQAIREGLND